MKTKSRLRLEIKEVSADGSFEGMLSPYGNVDASGDIVEAGAYTKTLKDRGNKIPLLWQHQASCPIGELTLEERPDGLWCKGQLLMADALAQRAYLFVKARIVKGLSIGFEAVKDAIENGVRRLKEIRLYEGSIVTFPANESALIASVKSEGPAETKGDFIEELTEVQLQDAGYQMRTALSSALYCVIWAQGLTRDEKIAAAEAVIQQFSDAYMAYLPAYLDMLAEIYGEMETWSAQRFETKSGRKFSAATKQAMQDACEQIKSGHTALLALLDGEEGDDETTLDATKAGARRLERKSGAANETKTEPGEPHSAFIALFKSQLEGLKQ